MTSKITRSVLEGYLNCKYKGWLRLSGEQGHKSDYETLLSESRAKVTLTAIEKILTQHPDKEVAQNVPLNAALLCEGRSSSWVPYSKIRPPTSFSTG